MKTSLFARSLLVVMCLNLLMLNALSEAYAAAEGQVWVSVNDASGRRGLRSKVELRRPGLPEPIAIRANDGEGMFSVPVGSYAAYVYVYDSDIPVLVHIEELEVTDSGTADVLVSLVEGMAGGMTPRDFDGDFDLVMDRVELESGTNPADPASYPGGEPIPFDSPVLDREPGWYCGELHARSEYGGGTETVKELVSRAEDAGLDFLAITGRNTMRACLDPDFRSKEVVLIPAMEWGNDDLGIALIYGPRTFPESAAGLPDAQGVCQRVQAQGGVFAIAHPCFPEGHWEWGVSYVNAIEVWCREWNAIPPISLDQFREEYQRRTRENRLVYSISQAVSTEGLSANGQAAIFWDYEMVRGLKASPIAGSLSSSPSVPLGRPVTYVYAPDKSVAGILAGLRRGRTMVTTHRDGPFIFFRADVGKDGTDDVGPGGIVPLEAEVELQIQVKNAAGKKVQLLHNGHPILTKVVPEDSRKGYYEVRMTQYPLSYSAFRVRVIEPGEPGTFGLVNVLAMSAPIYAQPIVVTDGDADPSHAWVRLKRENEGVPPATVTGMLEQNGRVYVRTQKQPYVPITSESLGQGRGPRLPVDGEPVIQDAPPAEAPRF